MPTSKPASPRTPLSPHKSGLLYGTASFETTIDPSHFDKTTTTKSPSTKMESITNAAEKAASKGAGVVGMNVVRMKRWFGRKLSMAGSKANGAAVTSRVQAALGKYDTVE